LRALIFLFLLAFNTPSYANATFRWMTTAGNGCCEATLVITDEAYAAGFFSTRIAHDGAPQAIPASPVVRLEITVYGDHLVFDRDRVRGFYDFDVTITNKALAGSIHLNNLAIDATLEGTQTEWTLKNDHSDRPGPCFRVDNACMGDIGRWILVTPPA
jgi:hypothetical protein